MTKNNSGQNLMSVVQTFRSSIYFLLINYKNILLYLAIAGFISFVCEYILIKILLDSTTSSGQILLNVQKILIEMQTTKTVSDDSIKYISSAFFLYLASLIIAVLLLVPLLLKAIPSVFYKQPLVEFKQIVTDLNHFARLTKAFITYFFYLVLLLILLGFVNSLIFTVLLAFGTSLQLPLSIISNFYFFIAIALTIIFLISAYRFSLVIPASLINNKLKVFQIYHLSSKIKIEILIIIIINFAIYFVLSITLEMTNLISPTFSRYSHEVLRLLVMLFFTLIQTKVFAKVYENFQDYDA